MFIETGGLSFYVRAEGTPGDEAPVAVMLHSLGTDHRVWDPQAEALSAAGCRVIRPDLRGHGLSEAPPGPYTIELMAADMLALLDVLDPGPAHLAGLSIGGLVAQAMAHRAPGRFASLILCDSAMSAPPASAWHERAAIVRRSGTAAVADAVLARWVTPAALGSPETRGLRAMLLGTAPDGYAGAAEAMAAADLTQVTPAVRLPALVLVGDQDQSTPLASARALRDAIPGASLRVIEGAAHIPTFEQAAAVTAAMAGFMGVSLA